MIFGNLFKTRESLVAVDIGASSIKLVELELGSGKPKLVNLGTASLSGDIFANNVISKTEGVAEQLTALLEANSIGDKRAITSVPGPSVFTKKIKMAKMDPAELASNVQLEAGNFIPHNIDAVKIDYHVIGESGRSQLDVLVVAVKDEILDSFLNTFSLAGLELAIVDVDSFAIQNAFELGYPELAQKTVALVNMGTRYSSINICKGGQSLFTGDVAVGGKLFTDNIAEIMGVSAEQAENLKRKGTAAVAGSKAASDAVGGAVQDVIDRNIEYTAGELNRQLSFFWNASGADESIDSILLCGGGAQIPGLVQELSEKTGIRCEMMDPLRGVDTGDSFEAAYLKEVGPTLAVAIGMAIRYPGDKIIPEYDEA